MSKWGLHERSNFLFDWLQEKCWPCYLIAKNCILHLKRIRGQNSLCLFYNVLCNQWVGVSTVEFSITRVAANFYVLVKTPSTWRYPNFIIFKYEKSYSTFNIMSMIFLQTLRSCRIMVIYWQEGYKKLLNSIC